MLQWRVFTLRSLMLSSQGQAKAGNAQQCTAMHSNAACCSMFATFGFPVRLPQVAKHCNGEVSSVLCLCGGRLSTFEACALFLREAEAADGCIGSDGSYFLRNQMLSAFSAPFSAKQLGFLPARAGLLVCSTWDMEGLVSRVSRQL